MSHSDSELNKTKREFKKKYHIEFKAKNMLKGKTDGLTRDQYLGLKRKLKSLSNIRLLTASTHNNVEDLEIQLALGGSPDSFDKHGRSALHIAASKGFAEIVKMLLENGADPNQTDNLGNTPLHIAACTHHLPVIILLVQAGADVRIVDSYGKTPLDLVQCKLRLLQRNWREGCLDMQHLRQDLFSIIDIMIEVVKIRKTTESSIDFEMMKLSLVAETGNGIDDRMSKLLTKMEGVKISNQ